MKIQEQHNKLQLLGDIRVNHIQKLSDFIDNMLISAMSPIIIDLNTVTALDKEITVMLRDKHIKAINMDKPFHIIGKENENIRLLLKHSPLNFIVLREEFARKLVA